ncbi:MAG: aminotransferase class V-fold PLP-dependent enzyme [Chloroflexota bacterium]|nr:aminotransferase class V-fold PLP-dependent enzyme [Chloroflexota bacterium]
MNALRDLFLLDPNVVFLNHGSFGACPKPVFEAYQAWQLELERQPVAFLGRRFDALMDAAREPLAVYLNTARDNLVYVQNATTGVNIVARSLDWQPGDEILTTDHEYGACNFTWEEMCARTGARYVKVAMPLPVTTHADFVERLWAGVTPRTKLIYLSHITSPTGLIFPVAEVCRRARAAGIMTLVDGAHAPGHIPIDLTAIDADFYTGNFHKWLCAPKGSAFLFARPEQQAALLPPTISWGWTETRTFVTAHQPQGTRDPAAYLTVPNAIQFQRDYDWDSVRASCYALIRETRERLMAVTELDPIMPDGEGWIGQMVAHPIPVQVEDALAFKTRLYDEYRVEAPIVVWGGRVFIRISVQGYNTRADIDHLISALTSMLH